MIMSTPSCRSGRDQRLLDRMQESHRSFEKFCAEFKLLAHQGFETRPKGKGAEYFEELVGKKANVVDKPAPPSEPIVTYANVSKARKLIGYEPKVKVEEGLKRFVEWMRAEELL